jgi:hypothetical protein
MSASEIRSATAAEPRRRRFVEVVGILMAGAVYSGLVGSPLVGRGSLVRWFAGALAMWLALACVLQAHDIPADITLQ